MGKTDRDLEILQKFKEKYNMVFNKGQEESVLSIDGPILVIAGPGSGKTFSIDSRLYNMISNYNIDPRKILVVTFSKASAKDMDNKFKKVFEQELIETIDGYKDNPLEFSTIHSFAYKILKDYSRIQGIYYKVIEGEKKKIISNLYKKIAHDNISDDIFKSLSGLISYCKNKLIPFELMDTMVKDVPQNFKKISLEYEEYKKANNYIDFDDMLSLANEALKKEPSIKTKYSQMYDYMLVDEAQDTSNLQFEIIKQVISRTNNIFCVGDDDQSIYEWRSAEVDNFLNFDKYFPNTKKIFMEQNYRSTKKIVGAANEFIKNNKIRFEKELYTENEDGENISIVECQSYEAQLEYIAKKVENRTNFKDVAVIFRNNTSAFGVANLFIRKNIPFYIRGYDEGFFNHWVLNDILAFLSVAMFPKDKVSFEKIAFRMNRYISGKMIKFLKEDKENLTVYDRILLMDDLKTYQKEIIITLKQEFERIKNKNINQAINYICEELGYFDYLNKVSERLGLSFETLKEIIFIIKEISKDCGDIIDFEEKIYAFQDELEVAKKNYGKNAITFTTGHSSKGLEWEEVFMIDLNNGVFPSYQSIKDSEEEDYKGLESERRLFYVGVTRPIKKLHLLFSVTRNSKAIRPSIFLKEYYKAAKDIIDTKSYELFDTSSKVNLFSSNPEKFKNLYYLEEEEEERTKQTSLLGADYPIATKVKKRKKRVKNYDIKENTEEDIKKENEKKIDSKYNIGMTIKHKKFGDGTIRKMDISFIEVKFDDGIRKLHIESCENANLISL